MSEPVVSAASDEAYRPISGFAVAALFLGGGFAALVAIGAAVAVLKGVPIFFPLWLLLMPIAGLIVGWVARRQITDPNSTRDGLRLANLAIVLATFSALGYLAYYVSIGLAVSKQADEFMTAEPSQDQGFLKHLMRAQANPSELDIAFLLTRPATARIKYRSGDDEAFRTQYDQPSNDAQPGEATRFKNRKFIRMIAQSGDKASFESLGAREWDYEKTSYKVARAYRVHTPQADFDAVFFIESTEPEAEGQHRQWFVNLNRSQVLDYQLTPLGKTIERLVEDSRRFLESDFEPKARDGKAVEDIAKFDKSDWPKLIAESGVRALVKKDDALDFFRMQARSIFEGKSTDMFSFAADSAYWPEWGQDAAGRFWIDHPIRLTLFGGGDRPTCAAEGRLRLRSKEPIDLNNPPRQPQWNVEDLVVERMRPLKG